MPEQMQLTIPVEFSKASIGVDTASIGVTVNRSSLKLDIADAEICGRRITCDVCTGDRNPDQPPLPGLEEARDALRLVADVKSIGVKKDKLRFSLSTARHSIDSEQFMDLCERAGTITIVDSIALNDVSDEPRHDDHEDVGPIPPEVIIRTKAAKPKKNFPAGLPEDVLRSRNFSFLAQYGLPQKAAETLEKKKWATVGECISFIVEHGESWVAQAGFSQKAADEIRSALARAKL